MELSSVVQAIFFSVGREARCEQATGTKLEGTRTVSAVHLLKLHNPISKQHAGVIRREFDVGVEAQDGPCHDMLVRCDIPELDWPIDATADNLLLPVTVNSKSRQSVLVFHRGARLFTIFHVPYFSCPVGGSSDYLTVVRVCDSPDIALVPTDCGDWKRIVFRRDCRFVAHGSMN